MLINTGMGMSNDWKNLGLTSEQCAILNDIGHGSNKRYGRGAEGFKNFLDSIDPAVTYHVTCIHFDGSTYQESFIVLASPATPEDTQTIDYRSMRLRDEKEKKTLIHN